MTCFLFDRDGPRSKRVHAPLAAVVGIADQPLSLGVDDPVESFERDLADQDRVFIADLPDIKRTITPLDRQPHRAIYGQR